jgi:hypothetical protein
MLLRETEKRLAEELSPKGILWEKKRYFGERASDFMRFPAPIRLSNENNIKINLFRMLRSRDKA